LKGSTFIVKSPAVGIKGKIGAVHEPPLFNFYF